MAKVTEKSLKARCSELNLGQLKNTTFGIRFHRTSKGYTVELQYRDATPPLVLVTEVSAAEAALWGDAPATKAVLHQRLGWLLLWEVSDWEPTGHIHLRIEQCLVNEHEVVDVADEGLVGNALVLVPSQGLDRPSRFIVSAVKLAGEVVAHFPPRRVNALL